MFRLKVLSCPLPVCRFHRQLSEPCLPFLQPDARSGTPYPAQSTNPFPRDNRPQYHRQMSEPVIPLPPRGFKQEMVDPRYPEQGASNVAANRVPSFHQMSIKQEPREFGIDSGEHYLVASPLCLWLCLTLSLFSNPFVTLKQHNCSLQSSHTFDYGW